MNQSGATAGIDKQRRSVRGQAAGAGVEAQANADDFAAGDFGQVVAEN